MGIVCTVCICPHLCFVIYLTRLMVIYCVWWQNYAIWLVLFLLNWKFTSILFVKLILVYACSVEFHKTCNFLFFRCMIADEVRTYKNIIQLHSLKMCLSLFGRLFSSSILFEKHFETMQWQLAIISYSKYILIEK